MQIEGHCEADRPFQGCSETSFKLAKTSGRISFSFRYSSEYACHLEKRFAHSIASEYFLARDEPWM